jgi:hypothetical protein
MRSFDENAAATRTWGVTLVDNLSELFAPETVRQVALITSSYHRLLGKALLGNERLDPDPGALALAIWESPLAIVSHGTEDDPLFNFGNRTALRLWEISASEFVGLPSRYSAETSERADRQKLLREVDSRGFSCDYSGVRVSQSGRRFRIESATVFNLADEKGTAKGQAAVFSAWTFL